MDNKPLKKPINFWNVFLLTLSNSIIVLLIVYIPATIALLINIFIKRQDAILSNNLEQIVNIPGNIYNSIFIILIYILGYFLVTSSVYHDLIKKYDININNYKKVLNYLLILLIINALLSWDWVNIILSVLTYTLFYKLFNNKFKLNKDLLPKDLRNKKNYIIIILGVFILAFIIHYFTL